MLDYARWQSDTVIRVGALKDPRIFVKKKQIKKIMFAKNNIEKNVEERVLHKKL